MKKIHIALIVIMVLLSVVLIIGGAYAFYLADVTGNEKAEDIVITSGNIELTFTEQQDSSIKLLEAYPGDKASKNFQVENTGKIETKYNIKLTNLKVTFEQEDLHYKLIEKEDDTYENTKTGGITAEGYINKVTSSTGTMYLALNIESEPSAINYYTLEIEFQEFPDVDQYYNQNKRFEGNLNIDDDKDATLFEEPVTIKSFSEIIKANDETIYDNDPDDNLRYAGIDPSNYIWFNCDDYDNLTQETAEQKCEKWRIIGLFKNIKKVVSVSEEGLVTYDTEDLVKIIREDSIGNISWDNTNSNNWANASLQKGLNGPYLNNSDSSWIKSDEYDHTDENDYSKSGYNSIDPSYKSITELTKDLIEQVTWNLGGWRTNLPTAHQFYRNERSIKTASEAEATWNGYIGLMYISDFMYATEGIKDDPTYNREECLNSTNSWIYRGEQCGKKSWLFDNNNWLWTITPQTNSTNYVESVSNWGYDSALSARGTSLTRPTLFLKSNVKTHGGNGSNKTPYILEIQ